MELLRSAGRLSAIDAPGYNAFAVALTGRHFESSPQTEAFLAKQFDLVRAQGAEGRQALADIDAFLVGLNAYNKKAGLPITPWTRNDVLAVATVIAARFGAGGGDEARARSSSPRCGAKLGDGEGRRRSGTTSRELDDPEAPVSVAAAVRRSRRRARSTAPARSRSTTAAVQARRGAAEPRR